MEKGTMLFSPVVSILKDLKRKSSYDVIKIIEKLDEKPVMFDFGAGNVMVIRYVIETVDARLNLFVPAVKSFVKKIVIGKFFELGAKRTYNFELSNRETNEWIIYVNRIKNLNPINPTLRERVDWQKQTKQINIEFPFDETWLDKCLPIKNNLDDCEQYFETVDGIDPDTLLSLPVKIMRIQLNRQIEVEESTGTIIKNLEYLALNHQSKIIRLYVPYFLKDLINFLNEKFLENNIVINKLRVFYKQTESETFAGFLWDPTLSGFVIVNKSLDEKLLSIKDGEDIFANLQFNIKLENIIQTYEETEKKIKYQTKRNSSDKRDFKKYEKKEQREQSEDYYD